MRAIPATAAITGLLGHAGNSFPAALGEENGELAFGMLPAAGRARDGPVGLIHRADRLEDFFAILTNIFVNWHKHLSGSNDFSRYYIVATFYSLLLAVEIRRDLAPGLGIPFQNGIGDGMVIQPVLSLVDKFEKRGVLFVGSQFGIALLFLDPANRRG